MRLLNSSTMYTVIFTMVLWLALVDVRSLFASRFFQFCVKKVAVKLRIL